jgi:hypothetical protein
MDQVAEAVGKSTIATAAISNRSSFVSQKEKPAYAPEPIYMGATAAVPYGLPEPVLRARQEDPGRDQAVLC